MCSQCLADLIPTCVAPCCVSVTQRATAAHHKLASVLADESQLPTPVPLTSIARAALANTLLDAARRRQARLFRRAVSDVSLVLQGRMRPEALPAYTAAAAALGHHALGGGAAGADGAGVGAGAGMGSEGEDVVDV